MLFKLAAGYGGECSLGIKPRQLDLRKAGSELAKLNTSFLALVEEWHQNKKEKALASPVSGGGAFRVHRNSI